MTTYLTIDAGIAFKLIAPHPRQPQYINLVNQWWQAGYQLCAPTLWLYEVTSTFTKLAQYRQLETDTSREGVQLACQLNVQLFAPDEEQALRAFAWTRRLQRAAAYDSFYLALAETLGCELWTTDKRLMNAAAQPWVKLVDERD